MEIAVSRMSEAITATATAGVSKIDSVSTRLRFRNPK